MATTPPDPAPAGAPLDDADRLFMEPFREEPAPVYLDLVALVGPSWATLLTAITDPPAGFGSPPVTIGGLRDALEQIVRDVVREELAYAKQHEEHS